MNKLAKAAALIFCLTLISCQDFSGSFSTPQKLKLVHTTMFGNKKKKTVPAGTYKAKFGFSSSRKVKLTLIRKGKRDIKVKIKLPKNAQFPQYDGVINIPAQQTGQKYDLKGKVATKFTQSSEKYGSESCSYTDYKTKCEKVCKDRVRRDGTVVTRRDGSVVKKCKKVCREVAFTVYGNQEVSYYHSYTDKKIKINLTYPGSSSRLATYKGDSHSSKKVYTFQGQCFSSYHY